MSFFGVVMEQSACASTVLSGSSTGLPGDLGPEEQEVGPSLFLVLMEHIPDKAHQPLNDCLGSSNKHFVPLGIRNFHGCITKEKITCIVFTV